jgi:hypothetical protein
VHAAAAPDGLLRVPQALAACINTNAHGVGAANGANTDLGVGLFPALSMLNHSCRPNCVFACAPGARPPSRAAPGRAERPQGRTATCVRLHVCAHEVLREESLHSFWSLLDLGVDVCACACFPTARVASGAPAARGAGGEMRVHAVRAVPAGGQLTVAYVNLLEPRRVRAAELAATKHFTCACERCCEPLAGSSDRLLEARQSRTRLPPLHAAPAHQSTEAPTSLF